MKFRSLAIILVSVLLGMGNVWASPVSHKTSSFKMDSHGDDESSDQDLAEMQDEFDYDEIITPPNNNGDSKIVYEKVELFSNSTWFTDSFYIDTAGTYQVIVTDFEFPEPLTASGLNITTAKDSLGEMFGPGSFNFEAGPGKYYVSFFARSSFESLWGMDIEDYAWEYDHLGNNLGQYGIEISMLTSAVPIPAAVWLFGSGLLTLVGAARGKTARAGHPIT